METKRASTIFAMLAFSSVAMGACDGIQQPLPSDAVASRSSALSTIVISGTVSDTSGITLGDILITLTGSAQAHTTTDFAGNYSFTVAPGSYTVTPTGLCATYEPTHTNLNNLTGNATADFIGSGGGCDVQTFSGGLSGSLTISGTVTSAGHGIPGARVTLSGSTQGFRVADQLGAYSFKVNPGSYSLSVSGGCSSFSPSVANLNNIATNKVQNFTGSGNCPIAPLALCPTLDAGFGISEPGSCDLVSSPDCAFDRASTWSASITFDFLNVIATDCRFGQWFSGSGALTETDFVQYVNDLITFSLYFFGCPATGTEAGPLTFQLIPAAFAGRTFTTADVAALSTVYSTAIAQSLSDAGAAALTPAQAAAVNNQLSFLAGRVPHLVTSSTFSASTCP